MNRNKSTITKRCVANGQRSKLVESLEVENAELRDEVVALMLQIHALRGGRPASRLITFSTKDNLDRWTVWPE
ncbi:MAG: hypothetical protein ABSE22_17180 [Xanthobacteraceae bacterium]|jgi:hypothetical protein